jgi:hypothetical protein
MTWTRKAPRAHGYYWCRDVDDLRPFVMLHNDEGWLEMAHAIPYETRALTKPGLLGVALEFWPTPIAPPEGSKKPLLHSAEIKGDL